MERSLEPHAGTEREVLLGWLTFHREALEAKCEGVAPADLIRTGLGGTSMSLLGLVRHLTEMERVYFVYALGGGELTFVYGPYEEGRPDGDFDELTVEKIDESFAAWHAERQVADGLIAGVMSMDEPGKGNRWPLRANVVKVIQEYARHNGHADLIRQSIDGAIGE